MQYPLRSATDEPANAAMVVTAHDQHIDIIVLHEQRQHLGRVSQPQVAVFGGDTVTFGQCLECLALRLVQCLGEVGVEQKRMLAAAA